VNLELAPRTSQELALDYDWISPTPFFPKKADTKSEEIYPHIFLFGNYQKMPSSDDECSCSALSLQ